MEKGRLVKSVSRKHAFRHEMEQQTLNAQQRFGYCVLGTDQRQSMDVLWVLDGILQGQNAAQGEPTHV